MKRMLKLIVCFIFLTGVIAAAGARQQPGNTVHNLSLQVQKSGEDTLKVNLFLRLSEYYFLKQNVRPADLDSSFVYASNAATLSRKLDYQRGLGNSYEQISKIYHKQQDTTQGKIFAEKAIKIFKHNNYLIELGYAYYDLSGYYSFSTGEIHERIRLTNQSLSVFREAGNKRKEADVLKELGDLFQIQGSYAESLSHLGQALKIYQSIHYPNLQGTYDLMGAVSADIGDYEQALKYGLLALKTSRIVRDSGLQVATIYNRIGITYEQLKRYDQAVEYWQQGLLIGQQYNDMETIVIISSHLARVLVQMNKPYEALTILKKITRQYKIESNYLQMLVTSCFLATYKELNQNNNAQEYCDRLLTISGRLDQNSSNQSVAYEEVIPFFIATRQDILARKYLAINENYCTQIKWPIGLSRNHLWWFKLDSAQGNYQAAILHYQQFTAIQDSLLNESTRSKVEQLHVQYETEKKDHDIQLKAQNIQLLTKQGELQQTQLHQAMTTKNLTLVGMVLLIVFLSLFYIHYQHKLRSHKKLEEQQREIEKKNIALQHLVKEKDWLMKEIHHRVKNNFHIVMGLLGTQSGYLKTDEALEAIKESQHRVHAMSLIHQKLYQSDNLSAINMADYIHELVDYLRDSFDIRESIRFDLQVERIELDLSHCIPLGLIMNEAITNCIKYAFPLSHEKNISIKFKQEAKKHLLLTITDNGTGLPAGFDITKTDSMGMNLMQGLSEDIGGHFTITSHHGTHVIINFLYDPELPEAAGNRNIQTPISI